MQSTLIERRDTGEGLVTLAAGSTIAGALLQIGLGLLLAPHQNPGSPIFGLISSLNATSHVLLLLGVAGLLRSGALGPSWLGRGGLMFTLAGLGVLIVAEVVSLIDPEFATILFSLATLAMVVGLIGAGVATLRDGRWTGWQRLTPLACGLFLALIVLPSFALPGYAANYAIGAWGGCWLLLGLAMRAPDSPQT